jgi:hypothetical protein
MHPISCPRKGSPGRQVIRSIAGHNLLHPRPPEILSQFLFSPGSSVLQKTSKKKGTPGKFRPAKKKGGVVKKNVKRTPKFNPGNFPPKKITSLVCATRKHAQERKGCPGTDRRRHKSILHFDYPAEGHLKQRTGTCDHRTARARQSRCGAEPQIAANPDRLCRQPKARSADARKPAGRGRRAAFRYMLLNSCTLIATAHCPFSRRSVNSACMHLTFLARRRGPGRRRGARKR